MDRRQLLALIGTGIGGSALPGCQSLINLPSSPSSSESSATDTAAPTGTLDQLSLDASVTEQPSKNTPAIIATNLTNTGEEEVRVGTGPTLVFRAENNAFKHGVLLYPGTYIGPNETPSEPTYGCWRYSDDDFLVQDILAYQRLATDEAISESHSVYVVGNGSRCLPEGEYTFYDEVVSVNETTTMTLEVTLTIDSDGQIMVREDETIQ